MCCCCLIRTFRELIHSFYEFVWNSYHQNNDKVLPIFDGFLEYVYHIPLNSVQYTDSHTDKDDQDHKRYC